MLRIIVDLTPAHPPTPTTRLAPSPTGALHLGNARTFLINWAMARHGGWRVAMRIEDLDTPRIKADATEQAIDVLRWLGIDWDGPVLIQSGDLAPYRAALQTLHAQGQIYPCAMTRSEIAEAAASAPHGGEHELRYPGTSRGSDARDTSDLLAVSERCWRVAVPDGPITFEDRFHGPQTVDVQQQVGDFVVASKAGLPAYQLSVVVDDARQGVTEVVRGDDLLGSTGRQLWLHRMLGLAEPRYTHVPLVLGADGRRLAKRHGDTRLVFYREQAVAAERVVGLLASWSGIGENREPMSATVFAERFRLDRLPREPVTFTAEDEAWLCGR